MRGATFFRFIYLVWVPLTLIALEQTQASENYVVIRISVTPMAFNRDLGREVLEVSSNGDFVHDEIYLGLTKRTAGRVSNKVLRRTLNDLLREGFFDLTDDVQTRWGVTQTGDLLLTFGGAPTDLPSTRVYIHVQGKEKTVEYVDSCPSFLATFVNSIRKASKRGARHKEQFENDEK